MSEANQSAAAATESTNAPKLVVGVGASAGGLEAFRTLLESLPSDSGMAFILVQHLDPTHPSLLGELLSSRTAMRVRDADQGLVLATDTVYVIRPGTALAVRGGRIELSEPQLHRGIRLPVDHLFRSLASSYGARCAGVVLSGAGSDGSSGLRDIKAAGGLTVAQTPDSCGQPGMPQSAIDAGVIDLTLPIADIPAALERFTKLAAAETEFEADAESRSELDDGLNDTELSRLRSILEAHVGFDLKVYEPATIQRRVVRRKLLSGFQELDSYFGELRSNAAERQALVRDLLISVTEFFRDPKAFEALRKMVLDPLVAESAPGTTLRAWVPGCATGEEAYSLGIELFEAVEAREKRLRVQVFATDVDQDALSFARRGLYPPSIADRLSERRLQKYFKALDGQGYRVRPILRDAISFAAHDLTQDPPFSRMSLISCRNVLIYLTPDAQRHVLKLLHFALEPAGHLLLGTSESTGARRGDFSTISKSQRIYRKVGSSRPIAVPRRRPSADSVLSPPRPEASASPSSEEGSHDLARRSLLQALVPPTVVVSTDGLVIFAHGELSPYLRIPEGDGPRFELTQMLRPFLATRARGVLYRCRRERTTAEMLAPMEDGDSGSRVRISARLAPQLGTDAVILTFKEIGNDPSEAGAGTSPSTSAAADESVVEQLEAELTATREDLRNTVEELETSNEELRSSNEESMSMNEELQSANEELEATTEELRSLNEELTTVNAQLRDKVELLEQANDDLHNFFASTKIATVFFDEKLQFKRFTPAARELLRVDHGDLGRFVGDIARDLLQHDLVSEGREALATLGVLTREIHLEDGRWFERQVLPYRTESRRVEGVVVTFNDVTEKKHASSQLAFRERQQRAIAGIGLRALASPDIDPFLDETVREVQSTLGTDFCKVLELQPGQQRLLLRAAVGFDSSLVGTETVEAGVESQAGFTLETDGPVVVDDLMSETRFAGPALLSQHAVASGVSTVIRGGGSQIYGVLGVHTVERRAFSVEDASFVQAVATMIGSSVSRQQARRRMALEAVATRLLVESGHPDQVLRSLLQGLGDELDACAGEVWLSGPTSLRLQTRVLSPSMTPPRPEHWPEPTAAKAPPLIKHVFETQETMWATDLGEPSLKTWFPTSQEMGLRTGVAFPITSGHRRRGVVMLLSHRRLFLEEQLLAGLEGIGRSVADSLGRSESERRAHQLASIVEASPDAIYRYDAHGRITEWLPGAERLYGYSAEEMVGASVDSLVPSTSADDFRRFNQRLVAGEEPGPLNTERKAMDGSLVPVSVRGAAIRDEGRFAGVSVIEHDVRELKKSEHQLLEAARQKDEFIALLGHELRNPLAGIRSASELLRLKLPDVSPEIARAQRVIERQSAQMGKLLDGLLDISRIVRGKIEIDRQAVDLAAVCREVASDYDTRFSDQNILLHTEVAEGPVWVEGDRVRFAQVLDNLFANALKYTPEQGEVWLHLRTDGEEALLTVKDTGVGIEPALLPYVFEVFRQASQPLDRRSGGLGLGLALVRSLVEIHGGTVEAESAGSGAGTTVSIRLPRGPAPDRMSVPSAIPPEGPLRILLIEDNEDLAEMFQEVLQLSGHVVKVAWDGETGLAEAEPFGPHVVLCDLGLPGELSGYDVARALQSGPGARPVLVALSGYASVDDRARSDESGFDLHLAKPVDLATLQHTVAQLRRPEPGPGAQS